MQIQSIKAQVIRKWNVRKETKKAVQRSLVKQTIRDLVPKCRKKRTSTRVDEESKRKIKASSRHGTKEIIEERTK